MSLVKRIFALFLGNGLTQILNFIFILLAVRIFNVLDYATFKQGTILVMTVSPLLVLGVPISIGYFLPKKAADMHDKARYTAQAILVLACLGLIGAMTLAVLAGKISRLYNNPALAGVMIIFAIMLFCDAVCSFYPFLLVAEKKTRRLATVSVFFAMLRVLCLLFTVWFNRGLAFFLVLNAIISLVRLAFMIGDATMYFRSKAVVFSIVWVKLREQIKYSFPLGISQILVTLNSYIDKNLTSMFYMPDKYAVYVNGAFEVPVVPIVSGSINSVLFPEFSGMYIKDDENAKGKIINLWHQSILACGVLLLPVMFALFVFADTIIELLFTKQYMQSADILRIYLLIIPTRLTYFGTPFNVAGKPRRLVIYGAISLIITVGAYLFVQSAFGFGYLALSVVAANYITSLLMLAEIGKIYGRRYSEVFPWKGIGKLLIIGAAISLPYKWLLGQIYQKNMIIESGACATLGVLLVAVMAVVIPKTRSILRNMTRVVIDKIG